jgi:hypothetical protein
MQQAGSGRNQHGPARIGAHTRGRRSSLIGLGGARRPAAMHPTSSMQRRSENGHATMTWRRGRSRSSPRFGRRRRERPDGVWRRAEVSLSIAHVLAVLQGVDSPKTELPVGNRRRSVLRRDSGVLSARSRAIKRGSLGPVEVGENWRDKEEQRTRAEA